MTDQTQTDGQQGGKVVTVGFDPADLYQRLGAHSQAWQQATAQALAKWGQDLEARLTLALQQAAEAQLTQTGGNRMTEQTQADTQPTTEAIVELTEGRLEITEPATGGRLQTTVIRVAHIEALQFYEDPPQGMALTEARPDDLISSVFVHMTSGSAYTFQGQAADLIYDLRTAIIFDYSA